MVQGVARPLPNSAVPAPNARLHVFHEGMCKKTKSKINAKNNMLRKLINFKWEARPITPGTVVTALCFLATRSKSGLGKFSQCMQRQTANKCHCPYAYLWSNKVEKKCSCLGPSDIRRSFLTEAEHTQQRYKASHPMAIL